MQRRGFLKGVGAAIAGVVGVSLYPKQKAAFANAPKIMDAPTPKGKMAMAGSTITAYPDRMEYEGTEGKYLYARTIPVPHLNASTIGYVPHMEWEVSNDRVSWKRL